MYSIVLLELNIEYSIRCKCYLSLSLGYLCAIFTEYGVRSVYYEKVRSGT